MINVIRCDAYLASITCLFLYQIMFVNYFCTAQTQYMLFWLAKDAL